MNALTITMAFLMGLTGSLHCAGMCGPIVWVMPFSFLNGYKKWVGVILYHFGRVSTYALLACVLHSFRSLFHPQIQQYISLVLGAILLLLGLLSFFPGTKGFSLPWSGYVSNQLGKFMGKRGIWALFITGVLNGLLPCGLVYMALSASVNATATMQSMGFMYAFGLGTMPMLVSITILKTRVSFLHFRFIKKMTPLFMFAFGCLFMLRGMNLGIPYLSPKLEANAHGVRASCCHKK